MLSDEQIIKRVLKGHAEEFRVLMQRHQAAVFMLAYRFFGRREDAEDIVQETFLRVYQSLSSLRQSEKLWPWVRRIALNTCLKRVTPEIPSDEVEQLIDCLPDETIEVEAEVLRHLDSEDIHLAIAGLTMEYRAIVVMRYMEDLSCVEISELLNKPASTVRVQLHRALKMLSKRLAVIKNEMH